VFHVSGIATGIAETITWSNYSDF